MVMGKNLAEQGGGRPAQATEPTPEEVSQLMDGELEADGLEHACRGLRATSAMQTWICYHVIGDALRGCGGLSPGFAERFSARFSTEPTLIAPPRRHTAPAAMAWALAASVAAVCVVGWVALTTMSLPPAAVATARDATAVRAADARRPVVNEYVLAHQEYSPTTPIQGVQPALRVVAADDQNVAR